MATEAPQGLYAAVLRHAKYTDVQLLSAQAKHSKQAEVYTAHSPYALRTVVIKIIPNGSAGERDAIINVRTKNGSHLQTIPDHPTAHPIEYRGTVYMALPRELLANHVPLSHVPVLRNAIHLESWRESSYALASELACIHEHGFVLGDRKPDNILVRLDGDKVREPKHIDFGAITPFDQSLREVTPSFTSTRFTLNTKAEPYIDVYDLARTIVWLPQQFGQHNTSPFYELYRYVNQWEEQNLPPEALTLEAVIDILDKPRKERRAFLKRASMLAVTSAMGTSAAVLRQRTKNLYEASENAPLEQITLTAQWQQRLGKALAKKVAHQAAPVELDGEGLYSLNPSKKSEKAIFHPQEEPTHVPLSLPEAAALSGVLGIAAQIDARAIHALYATAQAQIHLLETDTLQPGYAEHIHVRPLLQAYIALETQGRKLPAILAHIERVGTHLIQNVQTYGGDMWIPYMRPPEYLREPTVLATDTFTVDALLVAHKAQQLTGIPTQQYLAYAASGAHTLKKLIVNDFVHASVSLPQPIVHRSVIESASHARVAQLFWRVGAATHDTELLAVSRSLTRTLATHPDMLKRFVAGQRKNELDTSAAVTLYETLRMQNDPLSVRVLEQLIPYIPKATMTGVFWSETKRERKELIGGACSLTNRKLTNIGNHLTDVQLLRGLLI